MPLSLGGAETDRPQRILWNPQVATQVTEALARRQQLEAQGYVVTGEEEGELCLTPPEKNPNLGVFRIISQNGDDRIVWDRTLASQVKEAFAKFKDFLAKGYTAYAIVAGKKSHKLTEFNPALEEVLFVGATRPG